MIVFSAIHICTCVYSNKFDMADEVRQKESDAPLGKYVNYLSDHDWLTNRYPFCTSKTIRNFNIHVVWLCVVDTYIYFEVPWQGWSS